MSESKDRNKFRCRSAMSEGVPISGFRLSDRMRTKTFPCIKGGEVTE